MLLACGEAKNGLGAGQGPFGACIVKNEEVVSLGANTVTRDKDPTAHAEINAIRAACQSLNDFSLKGCEIYTTCEPCPMCLGAIYWSRIDKIYYGCCRKDAKEAGFDDDSISRDLDEVVDKRRIITVPGVLRDECLEIFELWKNKPDKTPY